MFDCSLIGPLVATLELLLEPNSHRIAMIALTVRNEDTLEKFHKSASSSPPLTAKSKLLMVNIGNTLHIEELECDWHRAPSFEIWEDALMSIRELRYSKSIVQRYRQKTIYRYINVGRLDFNSMPSSYHRSDTSRTRAAWGILRRHGTSSRMPCWWNEALDMHHMSKHT